MQRAQRQAFERCAQLAEHVLNTRALGEIALPVRVFAENAGDGTEESYNERDDPRELLSPAWLTRRTLQPERDFGVPDERGEQVGSLPQGR